MAKSTYSHAFLVGSFNGEITHEQLDSQVWSREQISADGQMPRYSGDKGYNGLCTIYYKAHLDAMIEGENVKRPDFLNSVHHYIHCFSQEDSNGEKLEKKVTLSLRKGRYPNLKDFDYTFKLCNLHLFFFPLDIVLFAIEIDDSETDLDDLTAAHNSLMSFWDTDSFHCEELVQAMKPLTDKIIKSHNKKLTKDGNKLKLFQTIKLDIDTIQEDLLYELGTSCPIGCVNNGVRPDLKPSAEYFKQIIGNNVVSTFDNWKGLALVDSFTMLGKQDSFKEDDCNFMYFPLVYLRCLFEKTFCFSRNIAYREDNVDGRLSWEIEQMERYYFYDNISYNFQPNVLYRAISKGLGIKEEREELTKQVKEREEKRFDKILAYVAIFAVFSVVWDLCSIFMKASPALRNSGTAIFFIVVGIIVACSFVVQIKYRQNGGKKFFGRDFF